MTEAQKEYERLKWKIRAVLIAYNTKPINPLSLAEKILASIGIQKPEEEVTKPKFISFVETSKNNRHER